MCAIQCWRPSAYAPTGPKPTLGRASACSGLSCEDYRQAQGIFSYLLTILGLKEACRCHSSASPSSENLKRCICQRALALWQVQTVRVHFQTVWLPIPGPTLLSSVSHQPLLPKRARLAAGSAGLGSFVLADSTPSSTRRLTASRAPRTGIRVWMF